MSDLKYWKDKIKEKRKNTSFRDFIKEIASWFPIGFYNNNGFISRYSNSDRVKIYDFKEFEGNRDNLTQNGIDYDFDLDFFKNFQKLFKNITLPNLFFYYQNEDCVYADIVANSRMCYLSRVVINNCENIFYSFFVRNGSRNVFFCLYVDENSENIYFSRGINKSYNIFYSAYINNSSNVWFSSNLSGCKECIFCSDLENISYCINNNKYSKEEYFKEKGKILKNKNEFLSYYKKLTNIGKNHNNNGNIKGSYIRESCDVENGYYISNIVNARNVMFSGSPESNENFFDIFNAGSLGGDDFYAISGAGTGSNNLYCSCQIGSSSNIFYSYHLESCSYCIGCVGLKNKSYCILNKQYSKKDREILACKIFEQMEKTPHPNFGLAGDGENALGSFFPGYLNPHYYKDTAASILGDFTKEEVEKQGYMWRDEEIKVDIPEGSEVIYVTPPARSSLPSHLRGAEGELLSDYQLYDSDGNWKINPEILKKVIKDENGNYYRIVKMEYDFLMKHSLPLPEIHWMDRMKLNFGVY